MAAVDKISAFHSFFVYFGGARAGFGGGSRQNSGISLVFCLLQGPHGVFLEAAVDKIQTFHTFLSVSADHAISSSQSSAFDKKKQPKQSTAFKQALRTLV
ncbi:hypothetical protein FC25_GL001524 [Ligilactobacillus ruminis DSM 20403 = NBRC 102161]|uniref:Uncharacterized protein n=1 Tax=Ligilactobacillus ruminis DSM 20403 = NBRC 102161 TaxID=1423798 RepID=A0A1I2QUJ5_9LACO|nr:hypothetical protein FC25_GL001524 [Ligilactobacillus ruminis DSM 20403 = NBRC 102161]SFG31988.1 hypothetical protein SAMN02910432_00854 [Ligilactobacillus ruminis DSM 20403 = NBRC 102161]